MMKLKKITEIGVAVKDLEKATKLFVDFLGAEAGEIITVERYQMRYRMCRLGNVDFELMEPLSDDGVIAKFIEGKGEGFHHIAFAVVVKPVPIEFSIIVRGQFCLSDALTTYSYMEERQ